MKKDSTKNIQNHKILDSRCFRTKKAIDEFELSKINNPNSSMAQHPKVNG